MKEIISSGVWVNQNNRWHLCEVYKEAVRNGFFAIYKNKSGAEIKREPMGRYNWRLSRKKTDEVLSGKKMVQKKNGTSVEAVWFTVSSGTGLSVVYIDPESGKELMRVPLSRLNFREKRVLNQTEVRAPDYDVISATYYSYGKCRNIPHNQLSEITAGVLSGKVEVVSEKFNTDNRTTTGVFRISSEIQFKLNVIYDDATLVYGELFATAIAISRVENEAAYDQIREALSDDLSKVINGDFKIDIKNKDDITIKLIDSEAVSSGAKIKWERASGSYVPDGIQNSSCGTPIIYFRLRADDIKKFRATLSKVR